MIQERIEFKPSLIGKVLDAIAPARWPADITFGLLRATRPYIKVLEGKISDPQKVEQITNRYTEWYRKFYNAAHPRKD